MVRPEDRGTEEQSPFGARANSQLTAINRTRSGDMRLHAFRCLSTWAVAVGVSLALCIYSPLYADMETQLKVSRIIERGTASLDSHSAVSATPATCPYPPTTEAATSLD